MRDSRGQCERSPQEKAGLPSCMKAQQPTLIASLYVVISLTIRKGCVLALAAEACVLSPGEAAAGRSPCV